MSSNFKNNDAIEFIQDNINSNLSEIVLKGAKNLELTIWNYYIRLDLKKRALALLYKSMKNANTETSLQSRI